MLDVDFNVLTGVADVSLWTILLYNPFSSTSANDKNARYLMAQN
jgi:hypothetical protein